MQSEVSHGNQWFMLMSGAANTLHMSTYHNYARETQPHQYSLSMAITIRGNMTASTRQPLPRVRIMANALRLSAAWKVALGTALRSKMRSVLVLHHSTLLRMPNFIVLYLCTILRLGWENYSHCNQHGEWIPEVWICAHVASIFVLSPSSLFSIHSRQSCSLHATVPTLKSLECATLTEL